MTYATLPADVEPNGCEFALLSFAITLRPVSGAPPMVIDRPGSRFRATVTLPMMRPDTARGVSAALMTALRTGLEIEVPLLDHDQGNPGTPLVNGSGAAGVSLPLKGMNPGYVIKAGYWLTLIDGYGEYYLHQASSTAKADGSGNATITIEPPLRAPLADGNTVLLALAKMRGLLDSEVGWRLNPGQLVDGFQFTLEESA